MPHCLERADGLNGVFARSLDNPDDLALARAFARATLVEVKVGEMPAPWQHIAVPGVRD